MLVAPISSKHNAVTAYNMETVTSVTGLQVDRKRMKTIKSLPRGHDL